MIKALYSLACAAAIYTIATPVVGAEKITVLGVTLGDKIPKSPRICSGSEIGTEVKSPCWIAPPYKHTDGSAHGSISLPGTHLLPKWAEYSTMKISISKDRTITRVEMHSTNSDSASEIYSAVTKKFGVPQAPARTTLTSFAANWDLPEVKIKLLCSKGSFCVLEFNIPADPAVVAKQIADQKKKDAARSDL